MIHRMNHPLSAISRLSLLALAAAASVAQANPDPPPASYLSAAETPMSAIVGSTHVGGRYHMSSRPFLKEGADRILELGSSTIKIWLNNAPGRNYYYNTNWGTYLRDVRSVTDLIRTPYYDEVLRLPFDVIVLMTTEFSVPNWKAGMSEAKAAPVRAEIRELTEYLLTEFRGSGKTFIIANWESDNNIRLGEVDSSLWPQYIQGMIDWTNARQDGIIEGRAAVGMDGVAVFGAFESNHIPLHATFAWPTTIDAVVPHTYCDLYSYSNWGTKVPGEEWQIIENLDYIAQRTPPSPYFGRRNVFLGEWGAYEVSYMSPLFPNQPGDTRVHDAHSDRMQREVVMRNLDLALRWGIPYALYWQIYCNGLRSGITLSLGQTAVEQQLRGVWLIRPPSPLLGLPYSYTSTWGSLAALMTGSRLFDDFETLQGLSGATSTIVQSLGITDWSGRDAHRVTRSTSAPAWIEHTTTADIQSFHIRAYYPTRSTGLVGWWALDEWAGSRINDFSGNGLVGARSIASSSDSDTAPLGFDNPFSARLDGTDAIRIPAAAAMASTRWSISGWFKVSPTPPADGLMTIAARTAPSGERQFAIRMQAATGTLQVEATQAGIPVSIPVPSGDYRDGQWHHFVLRCDGTTTQFAVDGQAANSVPLNPDRPTDADLLLGGMPTSSGSSFQRWHGWLDDFRWYAGSGLDLESATRVQSAPPVLADLIQVELSDDGMVWHPAPLVANHARATPGSSWIQAYLSPSQPLPRGMRYMRTHLLGADSNYPQLGDLALFTAQRLDQQLAFTDFRHVHSSSANWKIDETADGPLAVRTTNQDGWLVHFGNSISRIEHSVVRAGLATVSYAWSFDGRLWTDVAAQQTAVTGNRETWSPVHLPQGTRYVKLTIAGPDPASLAIASLRIDQATTPIVRDTNQDGISDLEASWLGAADATVPFSFVVEQTQASISDGVTIGFRSAPGTRYRFERAIDLTKHIWHELQTVEATSNWTTLTDSSAAGASDPAFYRVRLAPW
jgi:hypothetical protein